MAKTGFFHHIGTLLLLAATALLVITTISAPIINSIPILKVNLENGSDVSFGTFGYCILDAGRDSRDYCSGRHIGYNPLAVMERIDDTSFSRASENTSKALTRVMILHPVACGLAFLASLLALGSGFIGALLAALVSGLAFVVTLVVMATDFAAFGLVRTRVNRDDGSDSRAHYSTAMWTTLAATLCLFLATFVVLFTCCSSRLSKRRGIAQGEQGFVGGGAEVITTTKKRRFWQRRT